MGIESVYEIIEKLIGPSVVKFLREYAKSERQLGYFEGLRDGKRQAYDDVMQCFHWNNT